MSPTAGCFAHVRRRPIWVCHWPLVFAFAVLLLSGTEALAEPPASRFTLRATVEIAQTASSEVRAASGATISATGSDGTIYRLTIPPKALPRDMRISLTPLVGIKGVPGQTTHIGVDISPAGTRLSQLAMLVIAPRTPTPVGAYLLEHQGPVTKLAARPAFPARGPAVGLGTTAMWLAHFSGGSVVAGSPQTAAAMHPTALNSTPIQDLSKEWLEWQRNILQQDFEAGRIDAVTHRTKMQIINDRLELSLSEAARRTIEKYLAEAASRGPEANELVARGAADDWEAVQAIIGHLAHAERISQLMGVPATIPNGLDALFDYYQRLVAKCDFQSVPMDRMYAIARMAALFGREELSDSAMRCMCRTAYPPLICPRFLEIQATIGVWALRGETCGVGGPFQLRGTTSGGQLDWRFEPVNLGDGTFTVSGNFEELSIRGDGQWRIVGPWQTPSIRIQGSWCVGQIKCGPFQGEQMRLVRRAEECR